MQDEENQICMKLKLSVDQDMATRPVLIEKLFCDFRIKYTHPIDLLHIGSQAISYSSVVVHQDMICHQ